MQEPTQTERALLRVARTLAAAIDVEAITAEITATALELTGATGVYVERVISQSGTVEVIANAGTDTPPYGTRVPYPGSLTEEIIESREPYLLDRIVAIGPNMAPYLNESCANCTGVIVPLLSEGEVVGTLVLLRATGTAFTERDSNTARILGDLASVALKRVVREAEVRDRQHRFQALAENAAEAIVSLDCHDNIRFANPAAERIFGYSVAELLRMKFTSLIPERYRGPHAAGIQRYAATGTRHIPWDGVELTGLHRDGREIPLDVTFGEFEQGGQRFFTGLMRDITVRKRLEHEHAALLAAEQAARAAAERGEQRAQSLATAGVMLASSLDLRTTMQNLADVAIHSLADYCVIDVATDAGDVQRIAGAHADPARMPALQKIIAQYPPDLASEHPAARALRGGEAVIVNEMTPEQLRSVSRSPEHAALAAEVGTSSVMSLPLTMGGSVLGVVTLVRGPSSGPFDDTDLAFARDLATRAALAVSNARHYADAENARGEAEQGRAELERVIEGKSRLIRGFSHDIKNPLGAADGYAQLLLDGLMGELTPKQEESIGRIRAGIATALSLINDVVEFSRAESGQIEVRPSPFNADALVREVVEEHRAEAERAGARIETRELEGGQITCDAIRIRQILGNLVINAIKYATTDGPITVSVRREDGPRSRILFSVSDSGPGIPEEKQHLLFEEFQRLHTGRKEGSGLGLAISRRIARVLGGDVIVDSAAGRGSTFTLWIPAPPAD